MKTRNENKSGDQTFWISYADLMAGLMFVFMLIIGAVVVKYVLSQSDLAKLQKDLSEREKQIASSQSELVRKENVIKEIFSNFSMIIYSLQTTPFCNVCWQSKNKNSSTR